MQQLASCYPNLASSTNTSAAIPKPPNGSCQTPQKPPNHNLDSFKINTFGGRTPNMTREHVWLFPASDHLIVRGIRHFSVNNTRERSQRQSLIPRKLSGFVRFHIFAALYHLVHHSLSLCSFDYFLPPLPSSTMSMGHINLTDWQDLFIYRLAQNQTTEYDDSHDQTWNNQR